MKLISPKIWLCAAVVVLVASVAGQQPPANPDEHSYRGTWIASAGPTKLFRGRWWANFQPKARNNAQGSWTLLSESNQILLEGTWSAQKSPRGWEGTWSARVGEGRAFSGSWSSYVSDVNIKTFEDMLKAVLEKQIGGAWRKGRMQGNWWLQGPG